MGTAESLSSLPLSPMNPDRLRRLWAWVLGAGLLAGFVAWLGGEACRTVFKPTRFARNSKGMILQVTDRRDEAATDAKNAGLAFAILGGSLGAGLGIAGGLARQSGRAAGSAGLLGLLVGTAGCAIVSLAILPAYNAYKDRDPDRASIDMLIPLLVHAGIWSVAGGAGGLALSRGAGMKGRSASAVMGGFAGASFATVVFEVIGAAIFPEAQTTQFLSLTWQTRLLARLLVSVLASVGVSLAIADNRSQPTPPSA